MKPTKEECLDALELFLNITDEECINGDYFEKYTKDARETLQQLINKYFELIKAIEFIFGVKSEDVLKEYEKMWGE